MPIDNKRYVQDNYLRPDEIDTRNTGRLLGILDKWEAGAYKSLWRVLHDVYEIVSFVNPMHWQDFEEEIPTDFAQGHIKREQDNFTPYIKPLFLNDVNGPEVREALRVFRQSVEDTDEMNSFAIAIAIFEALSIDGDGGKTAEAFAELPADIRRNFRTHIKWAEKQPNPFHGSIANLRDEQAAFLKAPTQKLNILGTLDPEPESAFRARLVEPVAAMRAWCAEQGICKKLIANITADGSGSAAFRPSVVNYNYMRDGPEKDAFFAKNLAREKERSQRYDEGHFFEFETGRFYPEYQFHKEYVYPSPIAYVTTYAIKFYPMAPEDMAQMKAVITKGMELLRDVPPRLGNQVGYNQHIYHRPRPTFGTMEKEGALEFTDRVDLDDLNNLFYLLEEAIASSPAIAQTFNAARLVEARSTIKTYDQLGYGESYSIDNSSKVEQMGLIRTYNGAPLEDALRDVFSLYAIGMLDEKALVQQTLSLADMTLMGYITNRKKNLLSYNGMQQHAEETGHDVVTYDVALSNLTTAFMKAMVGVSPNTEVTSVANMVFQASTRLRSQLIDHLQAMDQGDMDLHHDRLMNLMASSANRDIFGEIRDGMAADDKALTISDALSGYKQDEAYYNRPGKDHERALVSSTRLVVRDPEIEPCVDRTFEHTIYTSRMSGSPWPRLDLPASLQRHLDPSQSSTPAQQALLSLTPK